MPTFKAVVRKHQERKDGKFPVTIRITQGTQSVYVKTGLYATSKQINKKTYEIKDSFILERTNKTIQDFEKAMLQFSTQDLICMNANSIKSILSASNLSSDYLAYCDGLIALNRKKWANLESAVNYIRNVMKIETLPVVMFTSSFIRQMRESMDNHKIDNGNDMKNSTKNLYISKLFHAFRIMCEEYNTDFVKVITHDPTLGYVPYLIEEKQNKSIDIKDLRKFFSIRTDVKRIQKVVNLMTIEFCLCGMNTADILNLKKENRIGDRISYNRQKVKNRRADRARTSVRIEPEIKELVEMYLADENSESLFNFGYNKSVRAADSNIDGACKIISEQYNLQFFTPYWFRHTWATIARNKCGVSKDDIDICLVHAGNNPMADVYIDPDWSIIDRTNRKVLDYVFHSDEL